MTRISPTIAVTGMGIVCAAGRDAAQAWETICSGRTGIRPLSAMEQSASGVWSGGEFAEICEEPGKSGGIPREVWLVRQAMSEALQQSGLDPRKANGARKWGLVLGTTLGGMRSAGQFLRTGDPSSLRTFLAGRTLGLCAEGLPELQFACTTCAACASGLYAMGLGVNLLQTGEADVVIAGGYDPISEYAYAGFKSLRLVADGPPKPFSKVRSGMNLGEGAGIVMLERAEDAHSRGAHALAILAGLGESSDVHHLTQPHPEGRGAIDAMRAALEMANCAPREIDLLCAHATATPANDAAEFLAYQKVFGEALSQTAVAAFKSQLGHTLGGAGAVELVLAAQALRHQKVPPTAGTTLADLEFAPLPLSFGRAQSQRLRSALVTSMGFGGANACAVLKVVDATERQTPAGAAMIGSADLEPVITGIGVVLADCVGNDAFAARIGVPNAEPRLVDAQPIPDEAIEHLLSARRTRRISQFARWMLAASTCATTDAGIDDVQSWAAGASAVLGSTHGAAQFSEDYYRQVVTEGIDAANPMLFAEGVPNVASAHVSLTLGIRGGSQTIVGSRLAGLEALAVAARRIRLGQCERAIVGAGEEVTPLMIQAYREAGEHADGRPSLPFEGEDGFVCGCGAVAMVMESRRAATRRSVRVRAAVESVNMHHAPRRDVRSHVAGAAQLFRRAGELDAIVSSANGTWVDRFERAAMNRAFAGRERAKRCLMASVAGRIGETFSAGPLAGIATVLLTGRAPRIHGAVAGVADDARIGRFGVMCTDLNQSGFAVLRSEA